MVRWILFYIIIFVILYFNPCEIFCIGSRSVQAAGVASPGEEKIENEKKNEKCHRARNFFYGPMDESITDPSMNFSVTWEKKNTFPAYRKRFIHNSQRYPRKLTPLIRYFLTKITLLSLLMIMVYSKALMFKII